MNVSGFLNHCSLIICSDSEIIGRSSSRSIDLSIIHTGLEEEEETRLEGPKRTSLTMLGAFKRYTNKLTMFDLIIYRKDMRSADVFGS
jgi:hypothetical protein